MRWSHAVPASVLIASAGGAHAVQYLSVEQARATLVPGAASWRPETVLLTEAQRKAVAEATDTRVRNAGLQSWTALDAQGAPLARVTIDEVTGKHDLITYAVAIGVDGRLVGIEILDYRESYGGEIRAASWRAQFRGKTAHDRLRLDDDIANIGGATLSCAHVTDGVRRLLAIDALVWRRG